MDEEDDIQPLQFGSATIYSEPDRPKTDSPVYGFKFIDTDKRVIIPGRGQNARTTRTLQR